MNGFWWSLLSACSFALVNITDKALLIRYAKSIDTAIKLLGIFSFTIFVVGILLFKGNIQSKSCVWLPISSGFFEILYINFYLRSISKELIAFVVPLFSLSPLIIALITYIIWGQHITIKEFTGLFSITLGICFFVLAKEGTLAPKRWSSLLSIIPAVLFYAITTILMSKSLVSHTVIESLLWSRLGVAIGAIFISVTGKSLSLKALKKPRAYVFCITEILYLCTVYLFFEALKRGNVSHITGIANSQLLFVFFLSYLLYKICPKVLHEKFYFKCFPLAILSIVILIISLGLLG